MPLFAVEIHVDQDELPAIRRAGPQVAGPTQFDWFNADGPSADESVSNGVSGIRIIVDAADVDEANFKALEEYTWMRGREGLSASDGLLLGTYIVNGDVARAEELLETAYLLIEGHEFEMAVVAAQVACELEIRAAIESRLSHLSEPLAKLARQKNRKFTLRDPFGEVLFDAAFGVLPRQTFSRWTEYEAHVTRRNKIVHAGAVVVEKDAHASRNVVIDLISWIRTEAPRARS